MNREHIIARAIDTLPDAGELTAAEIRSAILTETHGPRAARWKRDDLVALFGEPLVQQALDRLPSLFLTYLIDGVDFSTERVRARFAEGGDLRPQLGDALADALLDLGVHRSTAWSRVGGDGERPTEAEVDQVLQTILNQRRNRQRLADNYNAAAHLVEDKPAASWDDIAAILLKG